MNPFEKHGIGHLSASNINTFIENPAFWVLKYLYKVNDQAGPAAFRGHAVQHGLEALMTGSVSPEEAVRKAQQRFTELTQGAADDAHDAERLLAGQITANGITHVTGRPMPLSEQKIEVMLDGVSIPLVGYIDWLWPEAIWDLKTTKAMPSKAKMPHIRQMALYSHAKKLPATLLYLTKAKAMKYTVTSGEVEAGIKFITMVARQMQHILERNETRDEIAQNYVPDYEHFYWNDETISEAHNVWRTEP